MICIRQLEISTRATNALLGAGYAYVHDLTCKTPRHIMDIHGIGYGSLRQIDRALLKFGLRLGMTGPAYGLEQQVNEQYATSQETWPAIDAIKMAILAANAGDAPCVATAVYLNLVMDGYKFSNTKETP
jgi:hypothetical protein